METTESAYRLASAIIEDRGISRPSAEARAAEYLNFIKALDEGRMRLKDPENGKYWIDRMFLWKGRGTIVFAPQGQGKTNLCAYLIGRALILHPDWVVLTNIPFFWDFEEFGVQDLRPQRVVSVSTMSGMLKEMARIILNGQIPVIILDELDQVLTSYNYRKRSMDDWMHFIFIERHFKVRGPLMIYHEFKHIPNYLRAGDLLNERLFLTIHGGKRYILSRKTRPYKLVVTEATIPYSTHGLRGFNIDVDMGKLEEQLNAGTTEGLARQILDILKDMDREKEISEKRSEAGKKGAEGKWHSEE